MEIVLKLKIRKHFKLLFSVKRFAVFSKMFFMFKIRKTNVDNIFSFRNIQNTLLKYYQNYGTM